MKVEGKLIAVAGVVGVGKSTLAAGLGEVLGGRVIYEEYDKNPFLAAEFGGRKEAGLPSELFFLLSRARQLHRQAIGEGETVVSDYVFDKNRIYAEMNLEAEEMGIYLEVERRIERYLKGADVVVYLSDTVENCLERIGRRGREFERGISEGWLGRLHESYEALFGGWDRCPVIRIDCAREDVREIETVRRIVGEIIISQKSRVESRESKVES
ncbi:MAG: deoxynucleoside kinase [Planctomycetes bacterium]|nr:deoxynucleoside kinase [Planctomycetota bacterium]